MSLNDGQAAVYYFRDLSPFVEARKARDAERNKELMVATSTHELRTPLNGILGMLNLIAERPNNPDNGRFVRVARSSAKLMLALVNDMLDFTTIMMGKFTRRTSAFNVREAVDEAVELMRFQIEQKGLQLEVEVRRGVPRSVKTDVDRFKQLIINLLGNALKYTL